MKAQTIGDWQIKKSHGQWWLEHIGQPTYEIAASRIRTPEQVDEWCRHLEHKNWCNGHRLDDFVALAIICAEAQE